MDKKLIVISAVNLVEAGTLAILNECLSYLSDLASKREFRVIAIVFKKELVYYPNIEYIETQWPKKRWVNRLWYEYISMYKISKKLGDIYLWFSLHDTSPSVHANRRAVYCHNSYSSYKWKLHDLIFAPKIALFAIFTKYIYQTNIHENDFVVVQQNWFRETMSKTFDIPLSKIIVARPESPKITVTANGKAKEKNVFQFLFAGSPNSHKNFEIICKAAKILVDNYGISNFKITLTVKGNENKYASWLFSNWGRLGVIDFLGFVKKDTLFELYEKSDCLIFPSKVESWGLPISEYSHFNKPMLLADLPYTHETAAGCHYVAFFDPDNEQELANVMKKLIEDDYSFLIQVPKVSIKEPVVDNWAQLFNLLLR